MVLRAGIKAGQAYVEINAIDKVSPTLKKIGASMRAFAVSMKNIGRSMVIGGTLFGAAFLTPIASMIKQASDFAESMNFFDEVYGKNADAVREWSYETAAAMGRSKASMIDLMARAGGIFGQLDIGVSQATDLAKLVSQLSIDYASLRNLPDDRAFQQIISAIQGRPVSLSLSGGATVLENVRKDFAEEKFGIVNDGAVDQTTKALLRMMIVVDKMEEASGDAVRTARFLANVMKQLSSAISDAAVVLGQQMLPAAAGVFEFLKKMVKTWLPAFKDKLFEVVLAMTALTVAFIAAGVTFWASGTLMLIMMAAIAAAGFALQLAMAAASAATAIWGALMAFLALGSISMLISGIALVVVGLGIMDASIWALTGGIGRLGDWIVGRIVPAFLLMATIASTALGDVVEALKNGQIEAAMDLAANGIEQVWVNLIAYLKTQWLDFETWFTQKALKMALIATSPPGALIDSASGNYFSNLAAEMLAGRDDGMDEIKATLDKQMQRLEADAAVFREQGALPTDMSIEDWMSRRLDDLATLTEMINARLTPAMFNAQSQSTGPVTNPGGIFQNTAEETKKLHELQRGEMDVTKKMLRELEKANKTLTDIEEKEDDVEVMPAGGA